MHGKFSTGKRESVTSDIVPPQRRTLLAKLDIDVLVLT
jgi:hypothetical protein